MIIILAIIGLIIFFPFGSKLWDMVKADQAAETESVRSMEKRDPVNARKYAEAVRMAELARNSYRNSYR